MPRTEELKQVIIGVDKTANGYILVVTTHNPCCRFREVYTNIWQLSVRASKIIEHHFEEVKAHAKDKNNVEQAG